MELCSSRPYLGSTPSHVQMATFNTHSTELDGLGSPSAADSSAFQQAEEKKPRHQYAGNLDMKYHVKVSGLHSIVVEVCGVRNRGEGGDVSGVGGGIQDAATRVAGSIEFRNPYGYLSGIYYGYYPFEGCRAAVFFCFALFYAAALVRNWAHAMRIHFAIFAMVRVFLISSSYAFAVNSDLKSSEHSQHMCKFKRISYSLLFSFWLLYSCNLLPLLHSSPSSPFLSLLCLSLGAAVFSGIDHLVRGLRNHERHGLPLLLPFPQPCSGRPGAGVREASRGTSPLARAGLRPRRRETFPVGHRIPAGGAVEAERTMTKTTTTIAPNATDLYY